MKIKIIILLLIVISCDQNSISSKPESGSISGKVTFENLNKWPTIGSISISISSEWPPLAAPYAYKQINISDLSYNIYNYYFDNIDILMTLPAIAVAWKDPLDTNSSTNQHVIGAYGGTIEDEFDNVTSITLNYDEYDKSGVDFIVDLSLIEEPEEINSGSISGTISFSGNFPDGTIYVSLCTYWPLTNSGPYENIEIESNDINEENKYQFNFENILFDTYYLAVLLIPSGGTYTDFIPQGAYGSQTPPEYLDAQSITLSINDLKLSNLEFFVTFSD